jgi:hypothetical protein
MHVRLLRTIPDRRVDTPRRPTPGDRYRRTPIGGDAVTARVVVSPMPGDLSLWRRGVWCAAYWRYRCTACGDLGHWTTADYAHDDGREHARQCAALKYARLVALIEIRVGYYNQLADGARDIHWRGRWATAADSLAGLLNDQDGTWGEAS